MKHKAYMQNKEFVSEQKAHKLIERASLYDVPFLQNATLVQTLLAPQILNEKVNLSHLNRLWKWLKQTEEKARMS